MTTMIATARAGDGRLRLAQLVRDEGAETRSSMLSQSHDRAGCALVLERGKRGAGGGQGQTVLPLALKDGVRELQLLLTVRSSVGQDQVNALILVQDMVSDLCGRSARRVALLREARLFTTIFWAVQSHGARAA